MSDFDRWYVGKTFTADWTSGNFEIWTRFIRPNEVKTVLEVGSWEGRSAIFFLEFCPSCSITCIDTFTGSPEHAGAEGLAAIERRFDANVAAYGARVEKIKSRSLPALDRLAEAGRLYDIVYIDGSHQRDDVLLDSVLAWRVLKPDGWLIWDDYRWGRHLPEPGRPETAIHAFLELNAGELEVLHVAGQVLARRRAPSAARPLPGLTVPRNLRNVFRFATGAPITDMRSPRRKKADD
jgi:predicted O-methyltransferase YrrM